MKKICTVAVAMFVMVSVSFAQETKKEATAKPEAPKKIEAKKEAPKPKNSNSGSGGGLVPAKTK